MNQKLFVAVTAWLVCGLTVSLLLSGRVLAAPSAFLASQSPALSQEQPAIVVETKTTTWMPRGRNLQDAGPLVREKLSTAGFVIKSEQEEPPILSIRVNYQETRGLQYSFDSFGTKISCLVELTHPLDGTLWKIHIQESSGQQTFGTPPYIVALQKFQTNPYIYFLGDIVKARAKAGANIPQSLIQGFRRLMKEGRTTVDPLQNPHSMAEAESRYAVEAQTRVVQELGLMKDPHTVPFLQEMLGHGEQRIRIGSLKALAAIGTQSAKRALQEARESHFDQRIRQEAASVLEEFFPSTAS